MTRVKAGRFGFEVVYRHGADECTAVGFPVWLGQPDSDVDFTYWGLHSHDQQRFTVPYKALSKELQRLLCERAQPFTINVEALQILLGMPVLPHDPQDGYRHELEGRLDRLGSRMLRDVLYQVTLDRLKAVKNPVYLKPAEDPEELAWLLLSGVISPRGVV